MWRGQTDNASAAAFPVRAWHSRSWRCASCTRTFQNAASFSSSLIRCASESLAFSSAKSFAFTELKTELRGERDVTALVEAIRVKAPNWPTLESSCL
jgi:hypothetical protein